MQSSTSKSRGRNEMKPYNERLPMIDEAIEYHNGKWPLLANEGRLCFSDPLSKLTRAEFEQRAKELGWINGYKWGVEYETNGEKPDLPDGVLVEYKSKWVGWVRYDDGHDTVENWAWENSTAFKIYDERYKPKNVSEIPESNNNLENATMNND